MGLIRKRSASDQRIFFPWEGRGGIRRFLRLGRVGLVLSGLSFVLFAYWVGSREALLSGERQTRARLATLRAAVARYLAEHDGACPEGLDRVASYLPKSAELADAWGRPFRLVCPADREGSLFVLLSDGLDGRPGGLDRIEY